MSFSKWTNPKEVGVFFVAWTPQNGFGSAFGFPSEPTNEGFRSPKNTRHNDDNINSDNDNTNNNGHINNNTNNNNNSNNINSIIIIMITTIVIIIIIILILIINKPIFSSRTCVPRTMKHLANTPVFKEALALSSGDLFVRRWWFF